MAKIENSKQPTKKEVDVVKKIGGARKGAGRKPFVPTDYWHKQVEAMSGYGVPFDQIAALVRDGTRPQVLRCNRKAVGRIYRQEGGS